MKFVKSLYVNYLFFFTLGWGGGAGYFGFGWLLFCVGVVFGCFRVGFLGGFLFFFHLLCSHNFKVAIMTAIFFHNLILLKQIQKDILTY